MKKGTFTDLQQSVKQKILKELKGFHGENEVFLSTKSIVNNRDLALYIAEICVEHSIDEENFVAEAKEAYKINQPVSQEEARVEDTASDDFAAYSPESSSKDRVGTGAEKRSRAGGMLSTLFSSGKKKPKQKKKSAGRFFLLILGAVFFLFIALIVAIRVMSSSPQSNSLIGSKVSSSTQPPISSSPYGKTKTTSSNSTGSSRGYVVPPTAPPSVVAEKRVITQQKNRPRVIRDGTSPGTRNPAEEKPNKQLSGGGVTLSKKEGLNPYLRDIGMEGMILSDTLASTHGNSGAVCSTSYIGKEVIYYVKSKKGAYVPIYDVPMWDKHGIVLQSSMQMIQNDEREGMVEISKGKWIPEELFYSCKSMPSVK